jgi:hypothetical protein
MSIESNGLNEVKITRVPMVRRDALTPYEGRYAEPIDNTVGRAEIEKLWELTDTEKLLLAWEDTKRNVRLITTITPIIFTIVKGYVMKDWKTTIAGIVKAVFSVLTIFGISTGNITEALITAALFAIADLVQSWLMPDKSK